MCFASYFKIILHHYDDFKSTTRDEYSTYESLTGQYFSFTIDIFSIVTFYNTKKLLLNTIQL